MNRRRVLQGIGVGTATLLGATGVAGARGPPADRGQGQGRGQGRGRDRGQNLVETAVALNEGPFEGQFDTLIAAVQEAGLVDLLTGRRQLTVFAPTDTAFEAVGITPETVGDVDEAFLTEVLSYHVVPGRRLARSITGADRVPTLLGETVAVDGTTLNDGQAEIVATDVDASNGVIHAIDGVLLP